MKARGVFDIGKTNKKFFLFDENLNEIHRDYTRFEESQDEDGFPCDDIESIKSWITSTYHQVSQKGDIEIESINFSAYGASFVHLDKNGQVVSPLYNYLKPFPDELWESFCEKYGDEVDIATQTASPSLGMLNSGLQLYWVKHARPDLYKQIHCSIHLPQFLSYLFSGIPVSDYTSVGCHTMLWDYEKGDYHSWVYAEGIDRILAPMVETSHTVATTIDNQAVTIGVGIHDSSAALLPYLEKSKEPFLLLSTGTWSICLNPFNEEALTSELLKRDCLNFMGTNGNAVRASRLFLGNEYKIWIQRLAAHFGEPHEKHRSVRIDQDTLERLSQFPENSFSWESFASVPTNALKTNLDQFDNYDTAYHKLMQELVNTQVEVIRLALGNSSVRKIFVDGGFADNELFIYFLQQCLTGFDILPTQTPLGSAKGAAMILG